MSQFTRRGFSVAAAATVLSTALPVLAQGSVSGTPIKVGVLYSSTGPLALTGQAQRDAYLLAQKVVNQKGINGRPIELVMEDDASNPDTAVTKLNSLLAIPGITAILGPSGLAPSVATGGITSAKNIPQIVTAGIGLPAERERKCVFHMMPPQQINAAGLLAYADGVKAKRVAVLYDSGFGTAVMNAVKEQGGKYPIEFVATEKYDLAATDMSSQSAKVKAANPDLVFVLSASPTPFRNLRQLKVNAPLITPIAAAVYETVKAMGDSAEDVIFVDYLVPETPRAREKDFVDAFQAEYKRLPKNFEAAAWESVMLLTKTLRQVGPDAGSDKVCGAIRGKYAGAHTDYDFSQPDMTGIRVSSFVYSQWKGGKFTRLPFVAKD